MRAMNVSVGDHVLVESERVGQPPRKGTVEEVVSSDPLRLRVSWDGGSTSIITPQAGAVRVEHPARSTA
jgi:hypothetical protein